MDKLYKSLVSISAALYILWFLIPYFMPYFLSGDQLDLIGYSGSFAFMKFPAFLPWLIFGGWIVTYVGLFMCAGWARLSFLILLAVEVVLTVLSGVLVSTGFDSAILDINNTINGLIMYMIFISPLSKSFQG